MDPKAHWERGYQTKAPELISGGAVAWEGLRPPEGVDYQMFEIVRVR